MYIKKIFSFFLIIFHCSFAFDAINTLKTTKEIPSTEFKIDKKTLQEVEKDVNKQIVNLEEQANNYYYEIKKEIDNGIKKYNDIYNKINNFNAKQELENLKLNINKVYNKALEDLMNEYIKYKQEYENALNILQNIQNIDELTKNINEKANEYIKKETEKQIEKKLLGKFAGIQESKYTLLLVSTYEHSNDIITKYILFYTPLIKSTAFYFKKINFYLLKQKNLDYLIVKFILINSKVTNLNSKIKLYFDKIR